MDTSRETRHTDHGLPGSVLRETGAGGHAPQSVVCPPPNEIFGEYNWASGMKI